MTVKDLFVTLIEEQNIRHVYGVSGANIEDLFSSLMKSARVKPVLAKTEYQAALMAMGSYLVTQQVHVVLTTSGAGVLNTLPILAESYSSQIPLVLIAGLVPQSLQGVGGFQDTSSRSGTIDLEAMIRPSAGFLQTVQTADHAATVLEQAFTLAQASKKPSVVLVPKNIFADSVEVNLDKKTKSMLPDRSKVEIAAAVKLQLKNARQPLVILGEELVHCQSKSSVRHFIEKLDAKVAVTPCAKGFFDHRCSRFLGLTGMMGHAAVSQYLQQASDVVLLGTRMDFLSRAGLETSFANKTVFHISQFADECYMPVQHRIVGPLDTVLQELTHDL